MTTAIGDTTWYTIMGGQLVVAGWVAARQCSMWPVLLINLLVAIAVLFVVLPNFLSELAYISSGAASELLDYLSVILTSFEAVVIIASGFALWGFRSGRIIAWFGFAGNFGLIVVAARFFMTFKITRLF